MNKQTIYKILISPFKAIKFIFIKSIIAALFGIATSFGYKTGTEEYKQAQKREKQI